MTGAAVVATATAGSAASKAAAVALATVGPTINAFCHNQPYTVAALLCGTKACAVDALAQKRSSSSSSSSSNGKSSHTVVSSSFDVMRNVAFIVDGALYQGICQSFVQCMVGFGY
jgi:hypothetical protein